MTNNTNNFETYPPLFRQNHIVIEHTENENPTKDSSIQDSDYLPSIDFQLLNEEKLSEICKEWGVFRLVNHGIPEKLLNQLHEIANKLFSLKFESKQTLLTNPMLYFWGSPALSVSGSVIKTGSCPENINWLEGFHFAKISEFRYEDSLLESFRCLLEEYGLHQARLAKQIFETMAKDLDFAPKKSKSYLSLPTGFLRVYRYPRCLMADERWGIPEHTDSSVLSILHQDEVGGLQVYKDNQWLDVKPIKNSLIVNIGDMMQAMSDDKYTSVKHRVKVNKKRERVSIGYFVFPREDAVVESSKYKPFTYADFQATKELDLKTVGVKIGLPRFRIGEDS